MIIRLSGTCDIRFFGTFFIHLLNRHIMQKENDGNDQHIFLKLLHLYCKMFEIPSPYVIQMRFRKIRALGKIGIKKNR